MKRGWGVAACLGLLLVACAGGQATVRPNGTPPLLVVITTPRPQPAPSPEETTSSPSGVRAAPTLPPPVATASRLPVNHPTAVVAAPSSPPGYGMHVVLVHGAGGADSLETLDAAGRSLPAGYDFVLYWNCLKPAPSGGLTPCGSGSKTYQGCCLPLAIGLPGPIGTVWHTGGTASYGIYRIAVFISGP